MHGRRSFVTVSVRRVMSRAGLAVLALFVLASCGTDPSPPVVPISPPVAPPSPRLEPRLLPLPASPDAIVLRVPLAHARLSVIDVEHRRFSALRERENAPLVVNAGFFDPSFAPEGLVVSGGVVLSAHVESLSGGVLYVQGDVAHLAATEGFVLPEGTDFAIQCRPRLVVDRVVNIASETGRRDARTALCIRDAGRTLDVVIAPAGETDGATLLELAVALQADGCESALNLDGGPSTAAAWWDDGAHAIEPVGPVRQAIVVELVP